VTAGLLIVFGRQELRSRRERTAASTEVERRAPPRDPREAIALVGNAFAATHDAEGLLPVILGVTVEATGAPGGRVLEDDRELARVGEVGGNGTPLELELGASTAGADLRLLVEAPEEGFSEEMKEVAEWLATQAAIALENARAYQGVRRLALTDELTGLVNRRRFLEALAAEVARARRLGAPLSLLFADLDDFKRINDQFGHPAGDEALRMFSDLLRSQLRTIDTAGRLGGEEFAILLPGTDLGGAVVVGERIRRRVADRAILQETVGGGLTTSIGVVEYSSGTPEELLRRADTALYRAKAEGKNRVVGEPAP
jgi:diguanylate cyclase (GGDEF)-like protein